MPTLGEKIAAARKARGMTQEQLAEAMNMSRQGVSHWENGRTLPDGEMLQRLAAVLQYDFLKDALNAGEPAAPEEKNAESADAQSAQIQSAVCPKEHARYRRLCVAWALLGLMLGLGIGLLIGRAAPDVPEEQGGACIAVRFDQNPILAERNDNGELCWFYRVYLQETGGEAVRIDLVEQLVFNAQGASFVKTYTAGDLHLPARLDSGETADFTGGFPLQDASAIEIRVHAADESGVVHVFSGRAEFSTECK